ncbi:MAG: hypothetical protein K9L88_08060 [Chromatiaceae bacterium]|nr:hypothetical protein [Chromatiaceae bacterium]MCF8016865.1 hypothetical protein [Chromatiaceae bacterium]
MKNLREHLEAEEAARQAAEEARKAAQEAALAEAQAQRQSTLIALCNAYADALEQQGKRKSAGNARSVFKVHVEKAHPDLARAPARDMTPRDMATIIRRVREAGKERTAGVLRSYLRAAYAMAIRAPYDSAANATMATFAVEMNPVDAIPTIPVRAGHRTLSAAELRDYLAALSDELPDLALRLAVLAGGQRMSQLLRTRVADYNEDTQTLRLWDTKGKRREPREHLIPLAPKGAALVAQLIERAIATSTKSAPHCRPGKRTWRRLRRSASATSLLSRGETAEQRGCVFSKRMWGYGPLISAPLRPTSVFSAHSEPSVNLGDPE